MEITIVKNTPRLTYVYLDEIKSIRVMVHEQKGGKTKYTFQSKYNESWYEKDHVTTFENVTRTALYIE